MKRLRRQLGKLDPRALVDALTETLVPSGLGEEVFGILSRSVRVLSYSLSPPLEAPLLMPLEAGGIKLADTGRGFERRIVTDPGVPFEVELVQFGDRFLMNLKALDDQHREALVRYRLTEGDRIRREGTVLVSGGKGTQAFAQEDIEALRPEKAPLQLKIDVLLRQEFTSQIRAEDILSLVESLRERLLTGDSELALEAIEKIEGLIPEEP
jgi:hypothetical protein